MTNHRPDKMLSVTGAGNSTGIVICISSGSDYRRVSDATGALSGDTTGRGSSSQVAVQIKGYSTYCSILALIEKFEIVMTKIR